MTTNTPLIASELSANSAWLRRLARSLVGDGAADDVVQETMIAAIRNPPSLERPIRPWLGTVLRNNVRSRWRADSRRQSREQESRDGQPTPATPEEQLGKLQMQKHLVEAVMALDDIYRETIIMRFVDGLSAAQIATNLEVPAATIRSRTKRGLELLRTDLDRRLEGGRPSWRAALMPLIGVDMPLPIAAATAAASPIPTWVLAAALATALAVATFLIAPRFIEGDPAVATQPAAAPFASEAGLEETGEISTPAAPLRSASPRRFASPAERTSFASSIAKARTGQARPRMTFDYSGDRVEPKPQVEIPADETPHLDKRYLRRQLRGAMPLLAECFELAQLETPELEGIMTIDFVIDAEADVGGYVREAEIADGSPLTDAALAECVIETVYSLEFVAPLAGGEVRVRYPLEFVREDSRRRR